LTVVSLARRIEGIRFEERGTEQLEGLERPTREIRAIEAGPAFARATAAAQRPVTRER
jgi:hypothetical protein